MVSIFLKYYFFVYDVGDLVSKFSKTYTDISRGHVVRFKYVCLSSFGWEEETKKCSREGEKFQRNPDLFHQQQLSEMRSKLYLLLLVAIDFSVKLL